MLKKLEQTLYEQTMEHLAKLEDYVPGPVKKRGSRECLLKSYSQDPVFSIFGLDTVEYLAATFAGGTVTSIHRKIGDIYEACVKIIFMHTLNLPLDKVTYSATIRNGDAEETRSADAYLQFDLLPPQTRQRVVEYCKTEVSKLADNPRIKLRGVGMEVRHCYQTGDSKRTQADEAMARHLLVSGILPVMPLFCNQSNLTIIRRYSSIWVIKQGMEAYNLIKTFSGFDFYKFLKRNREDFRKPVIQLLGSLSK